MPVPSNDDHGTTSVDETTEKCSYTADIVIYGGTFAGVAAAFHAAKFLNDKQEETNHYPIILIVPDTTGWDGKKSWLGGVSTSGCQNFFDVKRYPKTPDRISEDVYEAVDFYAGGTFKRIYNTFGQFYDPEEMAEHLAIYLQDFVDSGKIKILYAYDIDTDTKNTVTNKIEPLTKSYDSNTSSSLIESINLKPIRENITTEQVWGWDDTRDTISITTPGTPIVFIDASDDGKLARLSINNFTIGAGNTINIDNTDHYNRTQVATLIFKVEPATELVTHEGTPITINEIGDQDGVEGGKSIYVNNLPTYNNELLTSNFAIKPFNGAQNAKNAWWLNMLLIFNVDSSAYARDNKLIKPQSNCNTVDKAWIDANQLISESLNGQEGALHNALYQFPIFSSGGVKITEVSKSIYVRESIHAIDENYGLKDDACNLAGFNEWDGKDAVNHWSRIGLIFYQLDINAYIDSDIHSVEGYRWGREVTDYIQSKHQKHRLIHNAAWSSKFSHWDWDTLFPAYVPYRTLVHSSISNLMLPGYAANVTPFAWSEVRLIPNLCVLGDAAGVTAAYIVNYNADNTNTDYIYPGDLGKIEKSPTTNEITPETVHLNNIQSVLSSSDLGDFKAILDKRFAGDGRLYADRIEVVTVLWEIASLFIDSTQNYTTDLSIEFKKDKNGNVNEDSARINATKWAFSNGILKGRSFRDEEGRILDLYTNVTRQEAVTLFWRLMFDHEFYSAYFNAQIDDNTNASILDTFSDKKYIDEWAITPFVWAVKLELIKGDDQSLLNPLNNITCSELAVLASRCAEKCSSY